MKESQNSDKSSLPSYKLALLLQDVECQKKKLASQMEELKDQLQIAETKSARLDKKTTQLAAKLEEQITQIEHLHLKLEETNKALDGAIRDGDVCLTRIKDMLAHKTSMRKRDEKMKTLHQKLDRVTNKLHRERSLKNKVMNAEKKAKEEVQNLQSICHVLSKVKQEKDKSVALQQELEQIQCHLKQDNRLHAERASADTAIIRELRATKEHLQQQVCKFQGQQSNISEREWSLIREVEDLRSQIKELTSASLTVNTAAKETRDEREGFQAESGPCP